MVEFFSEETLKFGCQTLTETMERVLNLGGKPILENCINSLTPANRLSGTPLSRFCGGLIESGIRVIDQKNDPRENEYLKTLFRKGSKR